ncbi:hypothetical protein COCSADRAFT_29058 [Bipolaris sorokiniana ND90Pr]|uniref:UmuC domain-containing protein n=1 Tax=Cochliobolus sativus (strain ND90Pr / ATCC 201652) TaxID=665912 RepID=M2SY67_COCSN|nr:uncharacterized protein COCSADRAFT_29058 [Bipolaris sorokiniana ND90Pr]EMD61747.1 hypothetical protein COCSADRAFT_29058 [Bipolaris sorokiniana ND90Pr]
MAWTIDVFFEAICFYFGVLRAEEEEHWNVSTNPCNVRATDVMTAVYGFSSVMSKVLGRLNKDDVVFRGRIAAVEIESHRERIPSSAHVVVPGYERSGYKRRRTLWKSLNGDGKTLHLQGNKADSKTFASGSKTWDFCGTASRERVKRQETTSNERDEQGRCAGQEAAAGAGICIGQDSTVEIFWHMDVDCYFAQFQAMWTSKSTDRV